MQAFFERFGYVIGCGHLSGSRAGGNFPSALEIGTIASHFTPSVERGAGALVNELNVLWHLTDLADQPLNICHGSPPLGQRAL